MEQEGGEAAAAAAAAASNRVGRTALLRKECTLNSDGNIRMELPRTHESVRSKWGVNLPHCYAVADPGKDLSKHVTSVTGSAPPCPSSSSTMNHTEAEIVVKEKTGENFRNQKLILSNNSHCSSRQGQFGFQYRSEIASRFKALHGDLVSKNMQLATMTTWKQNLNPLFSRGIYQKPGGTSACLKDEGSNTPTLPTNVLPVGTTQLKTLPTSGFSQLFLKKCLKGKGTINTESETNCPSSKNELLYSDGLDRSADESFCNGINLRELLNSSSSRRDKAESLFLFRLIVEFVDSAHSQGVVLQDLRASCFKVLPSDRIIYTGSSANFELNRKRPLEEDMHSNSDLGAKQLKLNQDMHSLGLPSSCAFKAKVGSKICTHVTGPQHPNCAQNQPRNFSYPSTSVTRLQPSVSATVELEKKWYASPEELNGRGFTFSSNVYGLGVLLFELLCCFESWEVHSQAMLDLHYRILPPNFLSGNPEEAGFCLWLLHPEPSSRPTTREILQSDFICKSQDSVCQDDFSAFTSDDTSEPALLLHFLTTLEEQKMKDDSKLVYQISCLEEDIKDVERGHLLRTAADFSHLKYKHSDAKWFDDSQSSIAHSDSTVESHMNNGSLMRNISKLEDAYFSMRSQIRHTKTDDAACFGKGSQKKGDKWSEAQSETGELSMDQKPMKPLGAFFEGLCKFARYSKFEVCGAIRNGDLLNSPNVICSVSLDRDEDFIAAAGISKKIKIFEFGAFIKDSIDIHYPVVEMSNKSKLSCVCWNNYIRNYLASTDYDGIVQMWDTGTGRGFCQYLEHQKRAWSVDFSQADPTRFASGSDDCSVKLWSINDRNSLGTIWSHANVCCLQFSTFSSHLLAFGSADYKVNCYDLRHVRIPLCTLSGHEKTISYVKFLDSRTLVSASTDNTLKLWDLNKTSSAGLSSNACCLTFSGHTNEKNFVGLSALDGYIACGSETNEVFCYYKSLPMPITSHKFGGVNEVVDDNGQFVSSVCWRRKSNMLVAANSAGSIELLKMV
ncbi:hypothetical protein SLE2022_029380 [Rubroshorea leprosula]